MSLHKLWDRGRPALRVAVERQHGMERAKTRQVPPVGAAPATVRDADGPLVPTAWARWNVLPRKPAAPS